MPSVSATISSEARGDVAGRKCQRVMRKAGDGREPRARDEVGRLRDAVREAGRVAREPIRDRREDDPRVETGAEREARASRSGEGAPHGGTHALLQGIGVIASVPWPDR
jgi:hypothetical protein